MNWILLSLLYAVINAVYVMFNSKHHYDGYVLGIWRGFGISLLVSPLLFTVPLDIAADYFLILIMQGIMIGIYDSHLFFATSRYGAHASSGFMATTVLVTVLLWWSIDFEELRRLLQEPVRLISLGLIFCGFSVSYWQMMKVHVSLEAEKYLYPAVFALALMSIATRYIALNGGSAYAGVVYYLTIACFVSGVYNLVAFMFKRSRKKIDCFPPHPNPPPPRGEGRDSAICNSVNPSDNDGDKTKLLMAPLKHWRGAWLIVFSTILIGAKTLAFRYADNPAYVMAMLLLSPMFAEVIQTHRLKITPFVVLVLVFLGLMLGIALS
ncbi:MAG: hypothetical protein NC218_06580 [Acetobacter sp.]|nr:hypothetical protein [Acetobacter sp.]